MPTQEYLIKYIEASARYQELPTRLKQVISEDEWTKRFVGVGHVQHGSDLCLLTFC